MAPMDGDKSVSGTRVGDRETPYGGHNRDDIDVLFILFGVSNKGWADWLIINEC
jgi:hypothetical protein